MKQIFVRCALLIAMGCIAATVVPTVNAQPLADMQATIPFEFQVSGMTLPAGTYYVTVEKVYRRVDIRSQEGRTVFVASRPGGETAGKESMLVFHRYGNTCFLREVLSSRRPFGNALPISKAERALVNVAGLQPVVETVAAGFR